MKKILFVLAMFAFGTTQAQTTEQPKDAKVEAPAVPFTVNHLDHDFGKIPQGKPVTTYFEVKNSSNAPIKIENVQASCGCTTPEWDKEKELKPGEVTKVKVGYNAASAGPFNRVVTIFVNGQSQVVVIKGEVVAPPATTVPVNDAKKDM